MEHNRPGGALSTRPLHFFWICDCSGSMSVDGKIQSLNEAIREFQKVYDKFADSSLADDALFRAGESAENLKNCTEARAYFALIVEKYPKSSLVKKAKDKDAALKAAAKNKAKCTS